MRQETTFYTFGNDIELTVNAVGTNIPYARHFTNKDALVASLQKMLQEDDVLLVKGSRSMKLEEVIERVLN